MDNDFWKKCEQSWARVTQKLDQNLSVVRTEYETLNIDERRSFKAWVSKLAEIFDAKGPFFAKARIQVMQGGDDGSVVTVCEHCLPDRQPST